MAADELPDINKLWNFEKPAETRRKFETLRLELLTQIARTHGLEGHFAKAHEFLDRVEKTLETAPEVVRVRYLLERGRTFNSSRQAAKADALFRQAWDLAREIKEHGYAVDAAHMLAITAGNPQDKLAWEGRAVEYAEQSQDERALAWLGTLTNNMGWSYHEAGRFERALDMHRRCLKWYAAHHPDTRGHRIARWSVAKQLRMLERYDEALKIQLALETLYRKLGEKDGFVQEEIGEIYLATGKQDLARPYFRRAYRILKETRVADEKERIARLKKLAGE